MAETLCAPADIYLWLSPDLCTWMQVREFEPSETGYSDDEDMQWGRRKTCCSVM